MITSKTADDLINGSENAIHGNWDSNALSKQSLRIIQLFKPQTPLRPDSVKEKATNKITIMNYFEVFSQVIERREIRYLSVPTVEESQLNKFTERREIRDSSV